MYLQIWKGEKSHRHGPKHTHFNRTHIFNQMWSGGWSGEEFGDGQGAKREKAFYNIILQNGKFSKGDLETKEEKTSFFS